MSFKSNKSTSYANMFTCVLRMHTSECFDVNIHVYTNKSVHDVQNISCALCDVVKLTKQLHKMS